MKTRNGVNWLDTGGSPGWITEEPDRHPASLAEAWVEIDQETTRLSPNTGTQERRALLQVFHAGAKATLNAFPGSASYDEFAARMATHWDEFARRFVRPHIHPKTMPVFAPEALARETEQIVEHQHGYFEAGTRAALLCLRGGISREAIASEIQAAADAVMARYVRQTPRSG